MPNHVIRDDVWKSRKLERCSDGAAAWYPWVYLMADDHGRFEYHPRAIWACVFRKRPSVTMQDVEKWLAEYEREGLLIRYHVDGELAVWTGFKGRKPSERRESDYPDPLQFPEVRAALEYIEEHGRPRDEAATKPRRERGKTATRPRQNRASAEIDQSGDGAEQSSGAGAPLAMATEWNREAADDYRTIYGADPPAAFFGQVKPIARKFGWGRTRPALRAYMAETPIEFLNIAKVLPVRIEGGHSLANPTRASPKVEQRRSSLMAAIEGGRIGDGSSLGSGNGDAHGELPRPGEAGSGDSVTVEGLPGSPEPTERRDLALRRKAGG